MDPDRVQWREELRNASKDKCRHLCRMEHEHPTAEAFTAVTVMRYNAAVPPAYIVDVVLSGSVRQAPHVDAVACCALEGRAAAVTIASI